MGLFSNEMSLLFKNVLKQKKNNFMKKILLLAVCAVMSVMGMAQTKTYTDNLVVTVDGNSTEPQAANVLLTDNGDGTHSFALKNFIMELEGEIMPVGNIKLDGLVLTKEGALSTFATDQVINVLPGDPGTIINVDGEDYELTEEDWAGPMLGDIPVQLTGKVNDDKVFVVIDINMVSLGQIIHVEFGSDDFPAAPTTYALTFVVDGVEVSTAELEEGAAVVYPEVAEKEGYTFAWEGETVATMPAEALTIKGGYTVNTYKVTYMADGQVVATYEVAYGEAMPAAPEYSVESDDRYTRTFEGWEGEELTTMPAHDVTYTANINIVDAIHTVAASKGAVIYDAQGRRVSAVRSGLYIINGKKVLK